LVVMSGAVWSMNASTGTLTKIFKAPATHGKKILGGCQINPYDSMIYCMTDSSVVRFDNLNMNFVAKLAKPASAATFDSNGIFYYEGTGYGGLYKVEGLDQLKGHGPDDDDLTDHSNDEPIYGSLSGAQDLVAISAILEGGRSQQYLITLNALWEVIVVRLSEPVESWTLKTTGDNSGLGPAAFGAGWSIENRAFFAGDVGGGVFEVADIDLVKKTASIKAVGKSDFEGSEVLGGHKRTTTTTTEAPDTAPTGASDGMQCSDAELPEEWAMTTTTTTVAPTKPPAETGKCLPGFTPKKGCGCEALRCVRAKA